MQMHSSTEQHAQSLFAAQPVFDQDLNRVGVELLYRSDSGVTALELGDNLATTELVCNLCSSLSEQTAHYNVPIFINVCANFLMADSFLPLDAENVVIELVERIAPTAEFIASVSALKRRGFRFALDDFEFSDAWEPLIALADIVKVDILLCDLAKVRAQMFRLRQYKLRWLAERVETQEQYEICKTMGFSLFQGYFLARPEIITGKKVPPAALRMAELISILFEQQPDIAKLSSQLHDEPALVMGMLRIANSPMYRKTREVSSVKELIVRLGLDLTRKWVLMFSVFNQCKPAAAGLVLTRAYATQVIAKHWQLDENTQSQFFLTALLSGVDILFGIAPTDFVAGLNISDDIKQAIRNGTGAAASAVKIINIIEQAYSMKRLPPDVPSGYFILYNQQQYYVEDKFNVLGSQ
jgi:c-di-GMP phosphodiesterase